MGRAASRRGRFPTRSSRRGAPGVRQRHVDHGSLPRSLEIGRNASVTIGYLGSATSPARPNPAFGRISLFDSGADSTYNGLFVYNPRCIGAEEVDFSCAGTIPTVFD